MRRPGLLGLSLFALLTVLYLMITVPRPSDRVNGRPAPLEQTGESIQQPLKEKSYDELLIRDTVHTPVTVLKGSVTDLEAGPIAGATILLRSSIALQSADPVERKHIFRQRALGHYSLSPAEVIARATTDADGRYLIRALSLPPSVYQVVARQENLAPQRQTWIWVGQPGELDFQLGPGASITGSVLDQDGSPVSYAKISALTQGDEGRGNWSGEPELIDQTHSGPDGLFRLAVYPGKFQLKATARGFVTLTQKDTLAGSREVQMKLSPGRRLTGTVLNEQGEPVPGAELAIWLGARAKHLFAKPVSLIQSAFSMPAARRTSNDDGWFEFDDLQTGDFSLLAQKEGYTPGVALGQIRPDVESSTVALRMSSGSLLSGVVVDLEGSPVQSALVALLPRTGSNDELMPGHEEVSQSPSEHPYQPISLYRAAAVVETDTQGRFRFDTLAQQAYDLIVEATDLRPRRLKNVVVGQDASRLTVVLAPGARLSGRVFSSLTGNAIPAATVIFGKGAHRRLVSRTDKDGWYHIGGLLEKEMNRLTVRAGGFAVLILEAIEVPNGSMFRRLDLMLDPAVQLSGTVVGPSGLPASGAWVHVEPGEQSRILMQAEDEWYARDLRLSLRVSAQSDAAGFFELNNVNPASSLNLCVRHPQFQAHCIEPFEGATGQQLSGFQIQLQNKAE